MILQRTFVIVVVGLVLASCDQIATPSVDHVVEEYLDLPYPPYNYKSPQFTDLQVQLGRVLFYDPNLSANGSISCASCHKQEYAFGDNAKFSKGFDGRLTLRNTLPLVDARQLAGGKIASVTNRHAPGGLFWDGRQTSMREAVMEPIFNDIEMGMDWPSLQEKLNGLPYYPPLFNSAFGRPEITHAFVQEALAAFVSVLQSNASRVERQELSSLEKKGAGLFATKYECVNCHQGKMDVQGNFDYQGNPTNTFNSVVAEFANIGLEESYSDPGLSLITKMAEDEGIFRVPSLSNVARTAPYMHDGSFASLGEVIDHYASGLASHPNLDARLRDSSKVPLRFIISEEEKDALVAFLNAFTDEDVSSNVRLSNPFKSRTKNRGRE